ncbi:hypothetical protein J2X57_002781 [Luteibacter sp. 1214]|nr:hypothetical protein [Luteibacter sp. 1214]
MNANAVFHSQHTALMPEVFPRRATRPIPAPCVLAKAALGAQLLTDFVHGAPWTGISRRHRLRTRQAMGLARMALAYGPLMVRGPVPWTVRPTMSWNFTEAAITGDGLCLGVLTLYPTSSQTVLAPVGFSGDSPLDPALVGQPWHSHRQSMGDEESIRMLETILWSGLYAVGYWETAPQSPLATASAARSSVSLTNLE